MKTNRLGRQEENRKGRSPRWWKPTSLQIYYYPLSILRGPAAFSSLINIFFGALPPKIMLPIKKFSSVISALVKFLCICRPWSSKLSHPYSSFTYLFSNEPEQNPVGTMWVQILFMSLILVCRKWTSGSLIRPSMSSKRQIQAVANQNSEGLKKQRRNHKQ